VRINRLIAALILLRLSLNLMLCAMLLVTFGFGVRR
jgi:hypothetical protein